MTDKIIIKPIRNIICLIGLIFISPLLVLIGLLVYVEDGSPIFFIQERIGRNKEVFRIIKIRTLKNNAPNTGTHKLKKAHILGNGKWIRKFKLDEFPQLINVLKGDINLVGPRPGLISQDELYNERLKKNIYTIKPGITGLAQILGYDMSNPKKLAEIDEIYINNKNIYLNILVILGTFFNAPRIQLKSKLKI
tara:strand:- start:168 stop:746 length:579 start_codon:yes stop_codon:yes gene_type:complete